MRRVMKALETALKHFGVIGEFVPYYSDKGLGFNCQTGNVLLKKN